MLKVNDDLFCKGKVTKKRVEGGKNYVDADIWLENPAGDKTTLGSATVVLPSRK